VEEGAEIQIKRKPIQWNHSRKFPNSL
jgi:hypothetical protein